MNNGVLDSFELFSGEDFDLTYSAETTSSDNPSTKKQKTSGSANTSLSALLTPLVDSPDPTRLPNTSIAFSELDRNGSRVQDARHQGLNVKQAPSSLGFFSQNKPSTEEIRRRNRESSRKNRERKREKLLHLEAENSRLQEEITDLKKERIDLKAQIRELEGQNFLLVENIPQVPVQEDVFYYHMSYNK